VGDQVDGLVIVDKPGGITSHDVVSRMRRIAQTRRVGHAGTLDPMATGVLVLGLNRGTRLLHYLIGADKTYEATIRLGVTTTTEDVEGQIVQMIGAPHLNQDQIEAAVGSLRGEIMQVPSAVSAIKVDGKRSYQRVRDGEEVALPPRRVRIEQFTWCNQRAGLAADDVAVTDIDVSVTCSSGTYIRALARDLGQALGVGGHLTRLRRTRVGNYSLGQSHSLEDLENVLKPLALGPAAREIFPVRELTQREARALSFGNWIAASAGDPSGTKERPVAGVNSAGELIALLATAGGEYRPVVVFAPAP